jgi:hypothetical protein
MRVAQNLLSDLLLIDHEMLQRPERFEVRDSNLVDQSTFSASECETKFISECEPDTRAGCFLVCVSTDRITVSSGYRFLLF